MLALADMLNHKGIFVMMAPKLNRRLSRLGFLFQQAGDELDYHGHRAMFYLDRAGFEKDLSEELKSLYHSIKQDLSGRIMLMPYHQPEKQRVSGE